MSHKKIFLLALSCLLLLTACAAPGLETTPDPTPTPEVTSTPIPTPSPTSALEEPKELWGFPIDDTHDAFEVPTGGRLGTVLVTVEAEEAEYRYHLAFSVWRSDDLAAPIQTFEVEESQTFHWNHVVDANFDGHMDFGYMHAMGNQPAYWHYWIWDEEQGLFTAEPEFDKISWPQFDEETGIISGWARSSALGTGVSTFHQWIDGKLVCIRRIESFSPAFENVVTLTVEDYIDGEMKQVFSQEYTIDTDWLSIQSRWEDLSYHGEEPETLCGFPIDDTHDAFEVPTGGRLGTVLVTVEQGEKLTGSEFGGYSYTLSVWNKSDLTMPLQTFEEEGLSFCSQNFVQVVDANFDDHMDFIYMWGSPAMNWFFSLYVWDETQGQFVFETSFLGRSVSVDEETQTIHSSVHYTNSSGADETYRWENGELVHFRREEYEVLVDDLQSIENVTYELIDGKWQEISRETHAMQGS